MTWNTQLLGDDDGEYFCRVLLASEGVRFVPGAKVYYRMPASTNLSYIGRSEAKMVAQWKSMESHIDYIRSLEDSDRVRAACVQYLQNWLLSFYPDRLDLVEKAERKPAVWVASWKIRNCRGSTLGSRRCSAGISRNKLKSRCPRRSGPSCGLGTGRCSEWSTTLLPPRQDIA